MDERVSLIVVTYGGQDRIGTCLRSAQDAARQARLGLEVILIDNRPGDGTAEAALVVAPDARVIRNADNVGFARACNQGFEVATGEWWLLLNPDAELDTGALVALIAFAGSYPATGAVAPILTGAGLDRAESAGMQPGIRSAMGHFLLVNRLLPGDRGGAWRGLQLHRRLDLGPRLVDWASGGALLLRPEAVRDVGGFDPSFFLYAEDVDLGKRLSEAGWQTWLVPKARAHHVVAHSSGGVTDRWYVALHDYYARTAPRPSVRAFDLIAGVGLALRWVLSIPRSRSDQGSVHAARMRTAAAAALRLAIVGRR